MTGDQKLKREHTKIRISRRKSKGKKGKGENKTNCVLFLGNKVKMFMQQYSYQTLIESDNPWKHLMLI